MVYREANKKAKVWGGTLGWGIWLGLGFGQVHGLVGKGQVLMLLVSRWWFSRERGTGGIG
jgi:hypothetical protein